MCPPFENSANWHWSESWSISWCKSTFGSPYSVLIFDDLPLACARRSLRIWNKNTRKFKSPYLDGCHRQIVGDRNNHNGLVIEFCNEEACFSFSFGSFWSSTNHVWLLIYSREMVSEKNWTRSTTTLLLSLFVVQIKRDEIKDFVPEKMLNEHYGASSFSHQYDSNPMLEDRTMNSTSMPNYQWSTLLSYDHWPTLFSYYNISYDNRYLTIMPSIYLPRISSDDQQLETNTNARSSYQVRIFSSLVNEWNWGEKYDR